MAHVWTFGTDGGRGEEVAAAVIAVRCRPWRKTVILRDTAEELWVAEVTPRSRRSRSPPPASSGAGGNRMAAPACAPPSPTPINSCARGNLRADPPPAPRS